MGAVVVLVTAVASVFLYGYNLILPGWTLILIPFIYIICQAIIKMAYRIYGLKRNGYYSGQIKRNKANVGGGEYYWEYIELEQDDVRALRIPIYKIDSATYEMDCINDINWKKSQSEWVQNRIDIIIERIKLPLLKNHVHIKTIDV
jgi:hypothetical protein